MELEQLKIITYGIQNVLEERHIANLISKASIRTSEPKINNNQSSFFVFLKFKNINLKYIVEIKEATKKYVSVTAYPVEIIKTLIRPSKFKKKIINANLHFSDIKYGTIFRLWPTTKYWQDIVQLNPARVNIFTLLYGKLTNLLDRKTAKKLRL